VAKRSELSGDLAQAPPLSDTAPDASGVSPFQPEAPIMTSIESFLIEIDQILGKPSELDGQALRITSWELGRVRRDQAVG
jgi:hypothetical protein